MISNKIPIILIISTVAVRYTSSQFYSREDRRVYATGAIQSERDPNLPVYGDEYLAEIDIPTEFDAREEWPQCPSLKEIRDQFGCRSCVAHASAGAMTDRICIQSNGTKQFRFSAEHILSCSQTNACQAGMSDNKAWLFYQNDGVVSGGPFQSKQGCQPLTSVAIKPSICYQICTNQDYPITFKQDLKTGRDLGYFKTVEAAQREILQNGPITASFDVYSDFDQAKNKSKVYQHGLTAKREDRHAVKIIGWGVLDEIPYWRVANSWGIGWGQDNGFFKIRRGINECGFESLMMAGNPTFE